MNAAPASPLHHRLRAVVGRRSIREVGALTNTPTETVRRYVQGHAPSVEFLQAICDAFRVNPAWLLHGDGPISKHDVRAHALREANPTELLNAIAYALEQLTLRVARLEQFLQTMEARLRTVAPLPGDSSGAAHDPARTRAVPVPPADPARHIADAVPQRPPPPDGGTPPAGGA